MVKGSTVCGVKRAIKKTAIRFVMEAPPGGIFPAGDDRVKEGVGFISGSEIAGGIADHEDSIGVIPAITGLSEVEGFSADLLSGDSLDQMGYVMVVPLSHQCLFGGLRDNNGITVSGD